MPIGKITVVKTYIISKYVHLFSSLPNPPKAIIEKLEKLIYAFIWDGKPDKVARKLLQQPMTKGGLKMTNITNLIKALKITWIRRILQGTDEPWIRVFNSEIGDITMITQLGPSYLEIIEHKIKNHFWKDTIKAWKDLLLEIRPYNKIDRLTQPFWYNAKITKNPIFVNEWFKAGIRTVLDLISPSGEIYSAQEIS